MSAESWYLRRMTVEELKAETAKLPLEERIALTDWMASDKEVLAARHAQLRAEIQKGIDQVDRGEFVECNSEDELNQFFAQIRARGMARLEEQERDSAA
jgi:hypothetical protein